MMKIFFALIFVMVLVLSSCEGKAEQEIEETKEPKIVFEKPQDFKENFLPQKTKPKKESVSSADEETENGFKDKAEKVCRKNEEPMSEDIIGIDTENSSGEPISKKQLEYIIDFLEPEKWEKAKDYEPDAKCIAGTVFNTSNGGFIAANFYGNKTLILKKWGENQQHREYYFAPAKAAEFAWLFREKAEESAAVYDRWEDVSKLYPEYDEKLSYFGSGLNENYDAENYISEPNLCMLFNHACHLEKNLGILEKDEFFPYYPAKFVEELLKKYYLFDTKQIREMAGKRFDAENGIYDLYSEYGGAYPIPRVTAAENKGETLELYVDLHNSAENYYIERSCVLTVRLNEDGSWKYLSNKIYFEKNYEKTE